MFNSTLVGVQTLREGYSDRKKTIALFNFFYIFY